MRYLILSFRKCPLQQQLNFADTNLNSGRERLKLENCFMHMANIY